MRCSTTSRPGPGPRGPTTGASSSSTPVLVLLRALVPVTPTSIRYTLRTLFSFVRHYGRKNLVLVVLGDHQPSRVVGGRPGHDVPISIVAHDPAVLDRLDDWGWVEGMRPDASAPVWPMSAFRNRFFAAFGP